MRANKGNIPVIFADFTGGLNLSVPDELLADNECKELVNFEFTDGGALQTREGLKKLFEHTAGVGKLFYANNVDTLFFQSGTRVYYWDGEDLVLIGDLAGTDIANFAEWSDEVLVASGGSLQKIIPPEVEKVIGEDVGTGDDEQTDFYVEYHPIKPDSETIYLDGDPQTREDDYTIDYDEGLITFNTPPASGVAITADYTPRYKIESCESPDCNFVFVKDGRVVITKKGTDTLNWSGVGDETNWEFSGTESDALQLQVGYKDGGNITALTVLANDLFVFKDNKKLYRVIGHYPDWMVTLVSADIYCSNPDAICRYGNNAAYVDRDGYRELRTVVEYGDVKTFDEGEKINAYARKYMELDTVRLWHVKKKGQIWLKLQESKEVFVYSYLFGSWSKFVFPQQINSLAESLDKVYVSAGNSVYSLDGFDDDGEAIENRLVTKKILPMYGLRYILKKIKVFYGGITSGTINIGFKGTDLVKQIDFDSSEDIAYLDDDIAYLDNDKLTIMSKIRSKSYTLNLSCKELQIEIIANGRCRFYGIKTQITEA